MMHFSLVLWFAPNSLSMLSQCFQFFFNTFTSLSMFPILFFMLLLLSQCFHFLNTSTSISQHSHFFSNALSMLLLPSQDFQFSLCVPTSLSRLPLLSQDFHFSFSTLNSLSMLPLLSQCFLNTSITLSQCSYFSQHFHFFLISTLPLLSLNASTHSKLPLFSWFTSTIKG